MCSTGIMLRSMRPQLFRKYHLTYFANRVLPVLPEARAEDVGEMLAESSSLAGWIPKAERVPRFRAIKAGVA